MIPVVKFSLVEDFFHDLKKDCHLVSNSVVWANGIWRPSKSLGIVTHVSFEATAFIASTQGPGFIYKLDRFIGDVMKGDEEQLEKIHSHIAALTEKITQGCLEIGLQLRATGVIQT